jgi:hypothetical protein
MRSFICFIFLFTLAFSKEARAKGDTTSTNSLRLDTRYEALYATKNRVHQSIWLRHTLLAPLDAEVTIRSTTTTTHPLDTLSFRVGLVYKPMSFLTLQTGWSQHAHFADSFGRTSLSGIALLHTPQWSHFNLFMGAGWYKQFARLSASSVLPILDASVDHDFWLLFLGAEVTLSSEWKSHLYLSNWESIEIYNLHNPFAEVALRWTGFKPFEIQGYFRYQVFLGFGRRDSLTFGVALNVPLSNANL